MIEKTHHHFRKGFTLVEILVAMTILGIIGGAAIFAVNPKVQVSKAYDSVRQQDLSQIRNALDTYYHDKNCYPTTLNFGGSWKDVSSNTTYMSTVPQDPQALSTGYSYVYVPDNNSCPQWYALYGKLAQAPAKGEACALASQSGCSPLNSDSTWACVYGGDLKCSTLAAAAYLGPTITPTNAPTATPTTTPVPPTPTPDPRTTFTVTMTESPNFTSGTFDPWHAVQNQSVSVTINATDVSPITQVIATVATDGGSSDYPLTLTSGTTTNGTWSGSWGITDSINQNYTVTFKGHDQAGNNSDVTVTIK